MVRRAIAEGVGASSDLSRVLEEVDHELEVTDAKRNTKIAEVAQLIAHAGLEQFLRSRAVPTQHLDLTLGEFHEAIDIAETLAAA